MQRPSCRCAVECGVFVNDEHRDWQQVAILSQYADVSLEHSHRLYVCIRALRR
jgi:hypothetical protein